jgi:hypothetical protein
MSGNTDSRPGRAGSPGGRASGEASTGKRVLKLLAKAVAGVVAGVGAYLCGYALTFALMATRVQEYFDSTAGSSVDFSQVAARFGEEALPSSAKVVSWFYLGAHNVRFELEGQALGRQDSARVSITDAPVWNDLLFLVPPLVLLVVGYVYQTRITSGDRFRWLGTGVVLAVGYAAVSIPFILFSFWVLNLGLAGISLAPLPGQGLALTAAYGLVFGTAGAVAGHLRG